MSLLSVAELRALVQTSLSDPLLQLLIDREEAELTRRCGAPGDGTTAITETHSGDASGSIWLTRRPVSITSVTEQYWGSTTITTLATTEYLLDAAQGRIARMPPYIGRWEPNYQYVVTYVPEDERPHRKQVLIELCRLALEQTAMRGESVAGEYSYQAPDWEQQRARLYRRLRYFEV